MANTAANFTESILQAGLTGIFALIRYNTTLSMVYFTEQKKMDKWRLVVRVYIFFKADQYTNEVCRLEERAQNDIKEPLFL